MKKDILKIVLLVLILIIPFILIISESNNKPLLERIEKEGYSKKPKDSSWEFVKFEFEEGKIDLNINFSKKYKEPILLNVTNATIKDSLAIAALLKELKSIFPFKKIAYFSDFIGKDFESYNKNRNAPTGIYESFDEVMSYTIHISFDSKLKYISSGTSSFNINDRDEDFGRMRKMGWNRYYNSTKLVFGFDDSVPINSRQVYINAGFFESLWQSYYKNFENAKLLRPDFRSDQTKWIGYSDKMESPMIKDAYNGFKRDNEFLIKKIFSTDFKNQFENYMYQTYPWRYSNIFIDKEQARQKTSALIAFLGVLLLILGFTLLWNKKLKHPLLSYLLPLLIFFISFMSLHYLNSYLIQIEYLNHTLKEIIIFLILTLLFVIIISFLLWQVEKKVVFGTISFGSQLFFKLMITFLLLNFPLIIMLFFKRSNIEDYFEIFPFLYLVIGFTLGRGLLIYLNHFSDSLVKEKDVELSRLKEVNAQSELKLLQSHINPHFLYNALNSIAGLAHNNPDKTEKMALSLSDLFRYSINKKGQKMSTVKEEVLMVQNYLDIEKIRFGQRLKFELQVDVALENDHIPMYILQPLVENAIKHGISKIRGEGHISLEINKSLEILSITISDNGPDFPKGLISGHGLQTVYDLLRLSYGDKASLKWENTPKKHITISIIQTM
tara:strand:- start:619 stop:2619 length:2001 start_codon:yes stop_codon:yes gene_type:complete